MKKILVGITCYKNEKEVIDFIHKLEKQERCNYEMIVTVTCSNVKSFNAIKDCVDIKLLQEGISISVFNANDNLGYLNACLFGVSKVMEKDTDIDWIMISNTDISFAESNFFEKFVSQIYDDSIWCVGPAIRNGTDRYLNPYINERYSSLAIFTRRVIYSNRYLYIVFDLLSGFKKFFFKNKNAANKKLSKCTYAVHGCIFFILYPCYKELLNEADGVFMYGEENLLAEIVRKNSKTEYYWADSLVYHNDSQSTKLIADKKKVKWKKKSIDYLWKKYYE